MIRVQERRPLVALKESLVLGLLPGGRKEVRLLGPKDDPAAPAALPLGLCR